MYCGHCGTQNADTAQFCGNCGQPLNGTAGNPVPPASILPQASSFPNSTTNKGGFKVSKIFIVLLYIMLGFTLLGSIGMGVAGKGSSAAMIKTLINWLLGVFFGFSVLGLIGSFITGIVLLTKNVQPADKSHNTNNGIWCIVGPILVIFSIIISYVIINVVSGLINPAPLKTGIN